MQGASLQQATTVGDADAEEEVWVEEVASRLGLPVGMLIRRIEAGVLPARRVTDASGVRYRVRAAVFALPDEIQPELQASTRGPEQDSPSEAAAARAVTSGAPSPVPAAELPGLAQADRPRAAPTDADRLVGVAEPPPDRTDARLGRGPDLVGSEALSTATLDARELVAALLDRFERTLDQRLHAEYQLRFAAQVDTRERRVNDLGGQLADLERQRDAADLEMAGLRMRADRLAEVETALERAHGELALLHAELAERDRIATRLRAELGERDRVLADVHAQLVCRDAEIDTLRERKRRGLFRR